MSESVTSAPVTTLLGPGGVGKTALAITVVAACSRDFPGGVTVVWLGSLRSADVVAAEVAVQLGLPRSGGQSYEDALTRWLAERDVLLVIDKCEHVVSAVADLVDALTARLPRLRVLATSREPLWIDGEVTYRLAPLAVVGSDASLEEVAASPAVQLFRERAGTQARGALDTDHARRLFGDICRRVDGLPLAIELAAARVAGLELEDIASHLDDLFNLLPQSVRRADGGQRSLRATVEWSDALLTEEERRLLRRMAVFAGGFDLTAIKEVSAADGQTAAQVADLTARLVEKSLLMKVGDRGPYQLLETIRQYSTEQLTAAGEVDAVRERHARFYLRVALHECAGTLTGPERPHIEVLRHIEDNVRIALECLLRIDPPAALELASGLNVFWWTQNKLREGIGWLTRALGAAPDAPAELRAAGLFCQGVLIGHDTDDWKEAAKRIDVGIDAVARAPEPPLILGMLLFLRGECDAFNGDTESAVMRTQAGLAVASRYGDAWGRGFCLWNAGYAKRVAGDVDTSIVMFTEMIEICARRGYGIAEMIGCNTMGEVCEERGELEKARSFWERALRLRQVSPLRSSSRRTWTWGTSSFGPRRRGEFPTCRDEEERSRQVREKLRSRFDRSGRRRRMALPGSRGRTFTGRSNASLSPELRAITRVQAWVWNRVRADGLRLLFLGAMTLGAAFILASSLAYFDFHELPPFAIEKLPVRFSALWLASLRLHVTAALVSLPLCILLMTRIVQRRRAVHRGLGRAAGVIILFALAPSGAVLAFDAKGGAFVTAGFLFSDALVTFFMLKGIAAARRRDLVTHRLAMGHVFAQMSVAVTSRAMLMALDVAGVSPDLAYVLALWLPVVGSAAAAEMFYGVWHSKVRFLGRMIHGVSKVVRSLRPRAPARSVIRVGR